MLQLLLTLSLHAASLTAAQSAFDRGEFDEALRQLAPLVTTLPQGPELGAVHLLRGQCFAALRQNAQVETAFTLALMNDPEAKLDANRVSPELVQTLSALALRLSGRLTLAPKNLQPGDLLWLDGERVDPGARSSSIGRREVSVQREGKVVWQQSVLVRPGQTTVVDAALPLPDTAVVAPSAEEPPRIEDRRPETNAERSPFSVMARLRIDPTRGVAFDLGAELTFGYLRLAVMASRGQFWGGAFRPSFVLRFNDRVAASVFAEAGVFASSPVSVSLGAGLAADFRIALGFELFVDAGGFYAPLVPAGVRQGYALIGVGARYRF